MTSIAAGWSAKSASPWLSQRSLSSSGSASGRGDRPPGAHRELVAKWIAVPGDFEEPPSDNCRREEVAVTFLPLGEAKIKLAAILLQLPNPKTSMFLVS